MTSESAIIELQDVCVRFPAGDSRVAPVTALDNVSLDIRRGETLSIVGESGCGKTTLARMLLGLVMPTSGVVRVKGADISSLPPSERRRALREDTQIVFQDPKDSLDPRLRIWRVISEPLALRGSHAKECRKRAAEMADLVGLDGNHLDRLPHELSGGQRQRVAIGRALAGEPRFLVLDEPTSALDVSVQAQILNLLLDLQERLHLTYLFISHDLSVVRHISDRVAVMYFGQIVELGNAEAITARPAHPYTKMLMAAAPRLDKPLNLAAFVEAGASATNRSPVAGCCYASRCPDFIKGCDQPQRLAPGESSAVRCWRATGVSFETNIETKEH